MKGNHPREFKKRSLLIVRTHNEALTVAATNFPLVRITNNRTGHVFYSRTHDHSSMAVASSDLVSTHFDVSATREHGPSQLVVVANDIPSAPVAVTVN